jgi:hypothetical protein
MEGNRIIFVCCASDSIRDEYMAGRYADEIVVTFKRDDFHLCSNLLVMNSDYKKMLKDVLRTSSGIVVSTDVIDLNILDELFIRRVLKGGYSYEAEVIFCDVENASILNDYRPLRLKNGFDAVRYIPVHYTASLPISDADNYSRASELLEMYNDDTLLHKINEYVFRTMECSGAGDATYKVMPMLRDDESLSDESALIVQNVLYQIIASSGKESESALGKLKDVLGFRAYSAFALLRIIYSRMDIFQNKFNIL